MMDSLLFETESLKYATFVELHDVNMMHLSDEGRKRSCGTASLAARSLPLCSPHSCHRVLSHLIYIFADSFRSYILTCKYGCSNGFFFAIVLGSCFDLSTGIFTCLHNVGLRMIAK